MAVSEKTKKELIEENNALRLRLGELERNEAKLRKADELLRESEFQYRTTIDSMRDAIHVVDVDLNMILINEKLADWSKELGIEVGQPIGRNIFDLFPFLPDKVRDEYRKMLDSGKALTTEEATQIGDKEIFAEVRKIPVCEDGRVVKIITIIRDITSKKLAEDALRESEQKFRSLAEQSPNMIFINKDGRIVYTNKKCEEITGYKREEFYSPDFNFFTLIAPQSLDLIKEKFRRHSEGRNVPPYEYTIINKAGDKVYAINSSKLIRYEGGNAILGVVTDITERKKAEEALKQSEEKYRSLIVNIPDVVWTSDEKGNTTFISANVKDIYGYSPEEIYTQGDSLWFGRIHPDDFEKVKDSYSAVFEVNKQLDIEYRVRKKDGQYLWIRDKSIGAYEKNGVKYADGLFSDISERKKAEQALKISELRFRSLIEQTTDAVFCYEYDPPIPTDLAIEQQLKLIYDGVLVECNDVCAKSYGAQRAEDVVGSRLTELFGTEPGGLDKLFRDLIEGGYRIDNGESIEKLKDGTERYYLNNEHGVIEDGKLLRVWGTFRDITEHRKAQRALAESEQRFRKFFENEPEYCYMISPKGIILEVNSAVLSALGYAKEDLIGKPIESLYAPESYQRAHQLFAQWKQTGEIRNEEMVIINRNGDRRIVLLSSTRVLGEDGKLLHSVSIQRDITERKRLEEAYHILVDSSLQGLAIIQDGRMVFLNKAFSSTTGYSEEELLAASPEQLQSLVYQEDRELVWTRHRDRLTGKPVPPRYEFRFIRKDGSTAWVEIHASEIEYRGRPAIQAAYIDITERKKAEEALRQSEERLKILFESAPDAIYLNDLKGNFVDGNKAAEKILGYTKAELFGKNLVETGLISSEQVLKAIANLKKISMGKPIGPDEFNLTRNDGSSISVEIRAFPVRIGDRVLSLNIAHDISARKKDKQKLLEHRAQLKSLASELSLTEERERHRLATNLHDQISQALVISRIKLQALHASVSSAEIAGPLEEACENLDRIIQDTRTLTFDLSSPILYELGFEAAVSEWLDEQIGKKHGIKTQFEDDGRPKPLEDDIRILLFRNVRELLINIVKHARARNVMVSIRRIRQQISVSVEDDGIGFDHAEVASSTGFGIFSIRERLEQLAGSIEIKSEPGRGSKITMTAPLKCDKISSSKKHKSR